MRIFLLAMCFSSLVPMLANANPQQAVEDALDAFHAAAARADLATYLGLLTPDAVFLGTDGSERWQGGEFRRFVSGHFKKGDGWTYRAEARHITLSEDGKLAWFDEALMNAKLGPCRGSGVLVLAAGRWRIAQYNLSVPIPNDLVYSVAATIQAGEMATAAPGDGEAGDSSQTAVDAVLEDGAGEAAVGDDSMPEAQKRCPKRHKTNRRADC